MELPDIQAAANSDPRGFLELYSPPVIFDEVQYAPGLFPYIKERVDTHRDRTGQYILTGSQNLLLAQRVTESLAGRAAVLRLLPLTFREILNKPQAPLPWEAKVQRQRRGAVYMDLWKSLLRGGYPELAVNPRLWKTDPKGVCRASRFHPASLGSRCLGLAFCRILNSGNIIY